MLLAVGEVDERARRRIEPMALSELPARLRPIALLRGVLGGAIKRLRRPRVPRERRHGDQGWHDERDQRDPSMHGSYRTLRLARSEPPSIEGVVRLAWFLAEGGRPSRRHRRGGGRGRSV